MAVRREKVLLELEDQFSSRMVKPIAATKALDAALDSLSGSAVSSAREQDKVTKSTKAMGDEVDKTSKKTRDGAKDIDRYSGRLRLLTEAAVLLGPALVPIGAVAVPATVALAAGLGAAVASVGVAVLAFKGLGDGLEALNNYQLSPTRDNLMALRAEMDALGPAGATFIAFLDSLEPKLRVLQNTARAGILPGVADGLSQLLELMPQVRVIVFNLATEMGRLSAEAGSALSGAGFSAFFDYLETDAAPTLSAFAHTLGNVAMGFGSLIVAFAPLSRDFSAGMESMSASFARWAAGLKDTDGFRSFVAYVRESGPQVLDLLGSLATAFIAIARAAAPVGAAVLPALTALARVLATIAESPIGQPLFTAAAAMLVLSRSATLATGAMARFNVTTAVGAANMAKLSAGLNFATILAGIWAVDKAFDQVFGDRRVNENDLFKNLNNLGSSDAAAELDKIGVSIRDINSSLGRGTDKIFGFLPGDTTWGEARDNIEKVDEALAQLVESGNADQAAAAMDKILASAKEQGISVAETTKWFDRYNEALANSKSVDDAAAAQRRYAASVAVSGRVNRITAARIQGATDAMEEQRKTALETFDAVTQYAQALVDARAQAKRNEAGLDASTKAGRNNRDALSKLAAAWNNQGEAIRNNVDKWREARKNFIDTATAMGAPISQARALADRLMEIPRQRVIDIKLYGSSEAADEIARIRAQLASVPRSVRTDYYVNQVNSISKGRPSIDHTGQADGGTVPKTGLPYADRHHYLLADGEEVISNRRGQADRFRPLLKAINNAADGDTVGGGTVGGKDDHRTAMFGQIVTKKDARDAAAALKELTAAAKATSTSLDRQSSRLDTLTSKQSSLRGGIESGLRADIFATPAATNPWQSSAMASADPLAALKSNNSDIRDFLADVNTLRGRHVTGAALAEALTNPAYADMLANMPAADLRSYQALYNRRERLLDKAGVAGSAATGIDLAVQAQTKVVKELQLQNKAQTHAVNAQTKELAEIRAELKKLRGEATSGQRGKR